MTTAGFHARRLARSLVVAEADHEDFQQIILMAILIRSSRYDAQRGLWSTFVSLLARNAVADLARAYRDRPGLEPLDTADHDLADPATADPELNADLRQALVNLPCFYRRLVGLIAQTGSLADAQRTTTMSPASFYRHVHDLRLRLLMAGLGPRREKDCPLHPYITNETRNRHAARRETVGLNGE
ncbi:hypothetical protein [Aquamicrobium terrae]|uniref:DNA-directed RNA polymerase specialized sigma24 family protein n=1 Tax=Aquamicrobium terrae TaxID=1324945 RepID=A0ABV2MZ81_9HYPH